MSFSKEFDVPIYLSSGSLLAPGSLTYDSPSSTYSYKFPNSVTIPENCQVSVYQMQIANSVFNITSALNNNTFSYKTNAGTTRSLTLADGYYSYSQFNDYLVSQMVANGDFLVNANGDNVYYMSFQVDPVHYTVAFTLTPLPSVLPSGWSNPNSMTLNGDTFQVIIPSTNMQYYLGISPGTYPASPATTLTYVISNSLPQVSSVTQGNLNLHGVANFISTTPANIFSFPLTAVVEGAIYTSDIKNILWYDFMPGVYYQLSFYLQDQSSNRLILNDPYQFAVTIRLRHKETSAGRVQVS